VQKNQSQRQQVAPAVNAEEESNAFALCILASIERLSANVNLQAEKTLVQVMLKSIVIMKALIREKKLKPNGC